MKTRRFYPEKYYDDKGGLGVPFWFWLLLIWQMRAWWEITLIVAGGTDIQWIPGTDDLLWWFGQLLAGTPAIVMFFLYPYRSNPVIAYRSYLLLMIGAVAMLSLSLLKWWDSHADEKALWLSLACFDTVLCLVICVSRHLRDVFRQQALPGQPDAE